MDREQEIAHARLMLQEALEALDGGTTLEPLAKIRLAVDSAGNALKRVWDADLAAAVARMTEDADRAPDGVELYRDDRLLAVDRGSRHGVEVRCAGMIDGKLEGFSVGGNKITRRIRESVATGTMTQWVIYAVADLNPVDLVPLADLDAADLDAAERSAAPTA